MPRNISAVTTGAAAPVALTTTSAATSASSSSSNGRTVRPRGGEGRRAVAAAVHDHEPLDAGVGEVADGLLRHRPGADHERRLVVEAVEDAPRELPDRDAGDRDAAFRERGLAPHPAGDAERRLEQGVRQRPAGFLPVGPLVGFLDLRDDLRLAEHHAVEAARDLEQVADGVPAPAAPAAGRRTRPPQLVEVGEETHDPRGVGTVVVVRPGGIDLDPVAGREHHQLGLRVRLPPPAVGAVEHLARGERQAFPQAEVRRAVVAGDDPEVHATRDDGGGCKGWGTVTAGSTPPPARRGLRRP